jgi:hypothetical protein
MLPHKRRVNFSESRRYLQCEVYTPYANVNAAVFKLLDAIFSKKHKTTKASDILEEPTLPLLYPSKLLFALPINNSQRLLALGRRRQILISVLRDQDIVFDPHASHRVVLLQELLVDVLRIFGILQVDVF